MDSGKETDNFFTELSKSMDRQYIQLCVNDSIVDF